MSLLGFGRLTLGGERAVDFLRQSSSRVCERIGETREVLPPRRSVTRGTLRRVANAIGCALRLGRELVRVRWKTPDQEAEHQENPWDRERTR